MENVKEEKSTPTELSEEELQRYRRQLILKEVGEEGQKRMIASKVLIIGAGGLGSPIALYLTAAGVGMIGMVDNDCVDLSNLQRQVIHSAETLGKPKVISAKERMEKLNPHVHVNTYYCKIDESNAASIIKDYDIVVNAVDNLETRYLTNKECVKQNKILIDGAINDFEGYVMPIVPLKTPCYECIYPKLDGDAKKEKKEIGVISCLPGVIGSLQAMETVKYILGYESKLENKILFYNALTSSFRELSIEQDDECPICGARKEYLC